MAKSVDGVYDDDPRTQSPGEALRPAHAMTKSSPKTSRSQTPPRLVYVETMRCRSSFLTSSRRETSHELCRRTDRHPGRGNRLTQAVARAAQASNCAG